MKNMLGNKNLVNGIGYGVTGVTLLLTVVSSVITHKQMEFTVQEEVAKAIENLNK